MSDLTLKDEDDFGFSTLHPAKRHHIDNAFNVVAREASIDGGSRPAISSDAPGGFIVEDEDEEQPQNALSYIPLSAIGAALRHLDLPSDDPEVLQVFRNAASGWGTKGGGTEGIISRDDFRSVCAVLLDNDVDLDLDVVAEAQDDSGSEDVEDEPDDDNDDDYFDPKPSKSRGKTVHKRARNHSPKPSKLEDDTPSLTSLQAEECRRAFALFFPDTPFVELDNKKITMEVVTRATRELGVKLKSDEIVEMLEAFSNSADKSMSFVDFQKMMVIARMV